MEARIRFYRINSCGYYDHECYQFGDISDILENLREWIDGKALNETQTYSANQVDNESNILGTYCYSIVSNSNEYLMTTWNENADVNGRIASIDGCGITGQATIETVAPPDGFISGYPAFFWFIPDRDIFATIQFNTRLNGRKNLDAYLINFLKFRSQYVIYDENNGENKIVGYGTSVEDCRRLNPRFSSELCRQNGEIEFIRNNRESIRKLIKKDKFKLERPETTTYWQTICRMLMGQQISNRCVTENKVSIELDMTPSEEELEHIISQWETDVETYPRCDVGFNLSGYNQLFWLGQSIASEEFELNIHFISGDVLVPTDRLLEELQRKQGAILNILHD